MLREIFGMLLPICTVRTGGRGRIGSKQKINPFRCLKRSQILCSIFNNLIFFDIFDIIFTKLVDENVYGCYIVYIQLVHIVMLYLLLLL